jgi:hypothetical protein
MSCDQNNCSVAVPTFSFWTCREYNERLTNHRSQGATKDGRKFRFAVLRRFLLNLSIEAGALQSLRGRSWERYPTFDVKKEVGILFLQSSAADLPPKEIRNGSCLISSFSNRVFEGIKEGQRKSRRLFPETTAVLV